MPQDLPAWMTSAFSRPRLSSYLRAAKGDPAEATRLYWWNVEVSAALYGPLHCVEITLRNAIHQRLVVAFRRADWWDAAPLNAGGRRLVADARRKCATAQGDGASVDHLVAELSFGFWVSLVSNGGKSGGYDRRFWVPTVHKAFPYYSGRRDALHAELRSLLRLRNRIMHHEPVHERDLAHDHAMIFRVLGHLSPEVAGQARALDRFPDVLGHRSATCSGGRSPRF